MAFGPDRKLLHVSENAARLLGVDLVLGQSLDQVPLTQTLLQRLQTWLNVAEPEFEPFLTLLDGLPYDVFGHRNDQECTIIEFERCPQPQFDTPATSLTRAHRTIEKLRRQKSEESLLTIAVQEIRTLTGFDRVMAYRFRPDESGEIVRECRREDLDDWEGRRYPASDIPRQARQLYVRNTLRLIVDTEHTPIAVLSTPASAERPLDMSTCILRSVSPIHIEYMRNMGVRASMSISIVVEGKLWGMIACHHFAPCQLPYGVRMACDVIAQVLSSTVASFENQARGTRAVANASLINRITLRATESDDLLSAISEQSPTPADLLPCDAMLCVWGGTVTVCRGVAPRGDVLAIVDALRAIKEKRLEQVSEEARQRWVCASNIGREFPELRSDLMPYSGFLAMRFDSLHNGWLLWLRREQIETVVWGGKPEKHYAVGPLGPRLTPRGSFEAWREDVRDTCAVWSMDEIAAAKTLRDELAQIAESRTADMERARTALLAMLGHDLRDPLHSISMAATLLTRTDTKGARMGERIRSSTSRMQRLISQVLDLSRLQGGLGLGMRPEPCDLSQILLDLGEELRVAHPSLDLQVDITNALVLQADPDRMAQVFSNLLGNARKHGKTGTPVSMRAWLAEEHVMVRVSNFADPIPDELMAHLFAPFKPESLGRNFSRSGLGLGLYIADQVVRGHDGDISVQCVDGQVHFLVRLPVQATDAPALTSLPGAKP